MRGLASASVTRAPSSAAASPTSPVPAQASSSRGARGLGAAADAGAVVGAVTGAPAAAVPGYCRRGNNRASPYRFAGRPAAPAGVLAERDDCVDPVIGGGVSLEERHVGRGGRGGRSERRGRKRARRAERGSTPLERSKHGRQQGDDQDHRRVEARDIEVRGGFGARRTVPELAPGQATTRHARPPAPGRSADRRSWAGSQSRRGSRNRRCRRHERRRRDRTPWPPSSRPRCDRRRCRPGRWRCCGRRSPTGRGTRTRSGRATRAAPPPPSPPRRRGRP